MYLLTNGGWADRDTNLPGICDSIYKPRFGLGFKKQEIWLFFTKRAAFTVKYHRKMGCSSKVISLKSFMSIPNYNDAFKWCYLPVRFCFNIGFSESCTRWHFYDTKFRKLKDEFYSEVFIDGLCKDMKIPALNAAMLEDSKLSYAEAEEEAKNIIERIRKGEKLGTVII